ncbi:MAG: hypothetical protein L3K16_05360 [Thermoplasmata archaeon]|nr:hypothetical protein [Thermoplasmata archaeon]
MFGFASGTVLLVIGLLAVPSLVPPAPSHASGFSTSETIPPWNTWTCNPPNLSPTALSIPVQNPLHSRLAGIVIGAAYEFRVVGYVTTDRGVTVYLPTAQAVFPTKPSGNLVLTIPAQNVTISGNAWSPATLFSTNGTLQAKTVFSTAPAYLQTSKYAVMANVPSGALTLEFRWRWTIYPAAGGVDHGPWSVPSWTATGSYLPGIFYPAPVVGIVSSSGSAAVSGSTYTLELNGTVANTSLRMVLEYPNNGTEIQSIWENTSVGANVFNSTLPLTYSDGVALPAGSYLVHVHDVCGAIVQMRSVTLTHSFLGGSPAAGGLRTARD